MLAAGLWLRGPGGSSSALFRSFLHAVPLRLGLAEGALAGCALVLAAGLWLQGPGGVFLVGSEGTVRHPPSLNFRSLFARRATALGSSGGRPGWLRPGRALAALVLAAGLWLRGPGESSSWVSKVLLGTLEASIFGSFSVPFCTPRLGLAEGALALAARPWRVFLMGFEGTVRHPRGPFSVAFCTPCHCAWVQQSLLSGFQRYR